MTEALMAVASAVIVPEGAEQPGSPSASVKRRQPSIPEQNAKRPRLSQHESTVAKPLDSIAADQVSDRRKSGQMEERKRGQRLFGALLGTLSQSSSSTAQKRRTDIERKQQAKLKLQADEFDEKKKQRLDAIMDFRRREQKKYDKQSMQIRHSNRLAQAQFLKTKAEPGLYYKPWELLPSEEDKIKIQITQAEQDVERETEQFDIGNPQDGADAAKGTSNESQRVEEGKPQPDPLQTVGPATDKAANPDSEELSITNEDDPAESDIRKTVEPPDAPKDHNDDGGEVVEGDEDTVIY